MHPDLHPHCPDYAAVALAEAQIKEDERVMLDLYKCPAGKWSIGAGRNLEDCGISQDESDLMLANDMAKVVKDLRGFSFWKDLSSTRKAALINLRFTTGHSGFRLFRKMLVALTIKDHTEAAAQMIDSKMGRETHILRTQRIAAMMRAG